MSVCYNGDETFVDMLEIAYYTVWTDLEAMVFGDILIAIFVFLVLVS